MENNTLIKMRDSDRRTKKYKGKLVGDIAKQRIDAYGPEQKKHFGSAIGEQVEAEVYVKGLVGGQVALPFVPYYIIFAKEVLKARRKQSGQTLLNEIEVLQNKWIGRGLSWELLGAIKENYVPIYPTLQPFIMDSSLLDGQDRLS